MSTKLKVIGVIIAVIGILAYFDSISSIQEDAEEMGLAEYFSLPHFMKNMSAVVGEVIVIGIGLAIIIIGVKICHSSK